MNRFFALNPENGRVFPGIPLAEVDLGNIQIDGLKPERGILVRQAEKNRLIALSRQAPPMVKDDSRVESATYRLACVAQEWDPIHGTHVDYHVLSASVGRPTLGYVMGVPFDPHFPASVSVLRGGDQGDEVWVPAAPHAVSPAPAGSGESLCVGVAYELYDFGLCWIPTDRNATAVDPNSFEPDTLRVRYRTADWIITLKNRDRQILPNGVQVVVHPHARHLAIRQRAQEMFDSQPQDLSL